MKRVEPNNKFIKLCLCLEAPSQLNRFALHVFLRPTNSRICTRDHHQLIKYSQFHLRHCCVRFTLVQFSAVLTNGYSRISTVIFIFPVQKAIIELLCSSRFFLSFVASGAMKIYYFSGEGGTVGSIRFNVIMTLKKLQCLACLLHISIVCYIFHYRRLTGFTSKSLTYSLLDKAHATI